MIFKTEMCLRCYCCARKMSNFPVFQKEIDFIVHFAKELKHPHVTCTVLCLHVFIKNLGDFRRIQTCELQDFI